MRGSRSLLRIAAVLILGTFLCAGSAQAQINTGRISGLVTDASGAAIPGSAVRGVNQATGVVTTTESGPTGDYLLNFLVPGTYRVEVESKGFQKTVQTGVTVNAGGVTRLDISLKVGELQEVVEVQSQQTAISTETSELSQTFTKTELDQLPNIDRNPLYQMNLLPGANNSDGSGNYGNNGGENGSTIGQTRNQLASLGGVDANANSVLIEGVFNREPQNAYVGLAPPVEGIQEVQIYTGKYNAEFGFSGSAVVNVVTKSGTNQYHGSAFEFLRNNATDARNFFTDPSAAATPFQRNQFGGALGGPIKKDRLFFFGDYQGTYFRTKSPGFATAPTDKMTQGDFSELYSLGQGTDNAGNPYGQIYDPFTRKFDAQGNVISATPFPGNIIPQSRWDPVAKNMNDAFLWGKPNRPGIDNNLYYLYRNAQTGHQADGRLDYVRTEGDRYFFRYSLLRSVSDNSTDINEFNQNGQADADTFNQNLQVTNQHSFSPSKMNELRLAYNRTHVVTSNKSMAQEWNNQFGLPNGNLGDPITQGLAEFDIAGIGGAGVGQPDWVAFIISNTISITDNFTWIKRRHNMKFGVSLNHVEDTSADTIGGDDPRGRLSFDPAMTSYDGITAPYAYPSFLLGTMTSSARARFVAGWPYQTYWQNAWYAQDDFKVTPSLTLNLGFRYELSTRPIERFNRQSNWDTRTNDLVVATADNRSPALQLDKTDVGPRVGFAWSPDKGKTSLRGGYGISYWQAYWSGPLTILGLTYPSYAKQAFVSPSLLPNVLMSQQGLPIAEAVYDASGKLVIPENSLVRGSDYNWKNQRVDQTSLNLEREIRPGMVIDIGYLGVRGRNNNHGRNINQAPPQQAGVDYNLYRPLYDKYPQLGDIQVQFSEADSWYDAVTARFSGRITKYLSIYATYAHGRNFANGYNINPADIDQYRGPTQQDIHHIFNGQFVFDLPVGRGKDFGSNMNPVLDAVLGGWQYSGLLHMRSGTRFNVYSGVSLLNNGQGNRPDRVGNGTLSSGQTIENWFDTTAFVDHTEPMTYGNSGSNPLFADNQVQLDSSLFKVFKVSERLSVQFRVDMFNTFNHPDFGAPDSTVGSSTEGQIFSTSVDNRRMQFGLRVVF